MAAKLPTSIQFIFPFRSKSLQLIHEEGEFHGCLQFREDNFLNTYAKFQVEKSEKHEDLFHIKCCFNNKYWRRRNEQSPLIVAAAEKTEEDQSKWSCTLFKAEASGESTFKFIHVQLGQYLYYDFLDLPSDGFFLGPVYVIDPPKGVSLTLFVVADLEILALPKNVAFKGDNGKYLCCHDDNYMYFSSSDIGDPAVGNQIIPHYCSFDIKNHYTGKYWGEDRQIPGSWIRPIYTDAMISFTPKFVEKNIIALRRYGSNTYCTRGSSDCLQCGPEDTNMGSEARLQVEELVVSRRVYDVDFDFDHRQVYDERIVSKSTANYNNPTSTEMKSPEHALKYEDSKTCTYDATSSLTTGIEMSFEATIPILEDLLSFGMSAEFSAEFGEKYAWGQTKESSTELTSTVKVAMPPRTIVKVELVATEAKCTIPFSYTQRDTLFNGEQITRRKNDGVYTGVNCFNYDYRITEEKIEAT